MEAIEIQTAGVVGAGTMGSGIAQLFAQNDFEVVLFDVSEEALSKAEERILKGLERAEKPSAFSMLRKTTVLSRLASCDFVIEAAAEDLAVKQDIFRQLDHLVEPPRILATNTSSLSISNIARAAENPDRIAGMHFFNPAPIMKLVEIVGAEKTARSALNDLLGLANRLGKTAILCKDTPGFVANRVARPFYLTGMRLLERGAGTPATIDGAVRELGRFRMGPFELADLIGLEVNLAISKSIYEALGRPERLRPPALQEQLVAKGCTGRKNSRGFYVYGENPPGTVNPVLDEIVPQMGSEPLNQEAMLHAVLEAVVDEAKIAEREGVAGSKDIDTAMRLGMNWPKGPFAWEKELRGLQKNW